MSYKKVLTCTTAGTIAIPSKVSHGCWEFDVSKSVGTYPKIIFISDKQSSFVGSYFLGIPKSNRIYFVIDGAQVLLDTGSSYIANNTWYRIKVARLKSEGTFASIVPSMTTEYPTNTFAIFIKGGSFGTDTWTLVDTTDGSGSNPVTNSTYTTSNYFVADLDQNDRLANLRIFDSVEQ
jgi:hypothetical protein